MTGPSHPDHFGPAPQHPGQQPPMPPPPPGPMQPPPTPSCRWCWLPAAANVSFRTQKAFIFFFTIHTSPGPYCHTCGLAMFRAFTTNTLALGWWGLPALPLNIIFIAQNLLSLRAVKRVPPVADLPPRPQLRTGKPIHRRPAAYVALLPALWAVWAVTGITTHLLT